jgi:release factor glutamine methyltransferase
MMSAAIPPFPGSVYSGPLFLEVVDRLRAAGCVFAEDEARLLLAAGSGPDELEAMVLQRAAGLPLEHILGWAQFCGLRIEVGAGVFVPRLRTELMVAEAVALARAHALNDDGGIGRGAWAGLPPVVVDLCCGSGAVGAAVAAALNAGRTDALNAGAPAATNATEPCIDLYATDIHPAAVQFARRNLAAARGHVFLGDLFAPLPAQLRGGVDILLANTPYVPTEEIALMPPEARLHEPRVTLDGGADGLDIQRRVAAEARSWLAPGDHLLVEASERQAPLSAEIFARNGLLPRVVTSEELYATIVIGTKTGGCQHQD